MFFFKDFVKNIDTRNWCEASLLWNREAAKHNRGAERKLLQCGLEKKWESKAFNKGLAENTWICKPRKSLSALLALILLCKSNVFSVDIVPGFLISCFFGKVHILLDHLDQKKYQFLPFFIVISEENRKRKKIRKSKINYLFDNMLYNNCAKWTSIFSAANL